MPIKSPPHAHPELSWTLIVTGPVFGEQVTAETLLEEIEAIAYPHASDPLLRRDQIDAARRRLDKHTWELAWAEGRAMTTEQAIAEALGGRLGAPRGATDA